MANDKKFVVKNGVQAPNVNFIDSNGNNVITASMLTSDVLSFSGNTGQLFSISDSMAGVIFAVNDISGIPSIEVDDTGDIRLAELSGNVSIGTSLDTHKLYVQGNTYVNGTLLVGGTVINSTVYSGTANNATYLNGQLASFYTNATNITTGTLPYAQIPANIVNTSAAFTLSGVTTHAANVILGSVGLSANGGFGTAGQVLHSNGTATYWAADDQGVTSVATANGLSGGTITSTGTIGVVTGSTLTVNSTGIHVNPSLSITDLTVAGNLTVSGTTTYINTTTLNVGDSLITLNADLANTVAPSENSGIEVNRGNAANVQFHWDETDDRWTTNGQSMAVSSLVVGNSSVSVTVNSTAFTGTALTANNSTYLNGQLAAYYTNATNITTGTLPYAQIPANVINTTAAFTRTGVTTFSANVVLGSSGLSANGGFGTAGQVLHSNGTATYWGGVSAGTNQQIIYNNNGVLAGSSGFQWNSGTNRLGIGHPNYSGNPNPIADIDIQANFFANSFITFRGSLGYSGTELVVGQIGSQVGQGPSASLILNRSQTDLRLGTNNVVTMTFAANGNIGVGSTATAPGFPLTVAGVISTSGGIRFADGTTQTTSGAGGSDEFGRTIALLGY